MNISNRCCHYTTPYYIHTSLCRFIIQFQILPASRACSVNQPLFLRRHETPLYSVEPKPCLSRHEHLSCHACVSQLSKTTVRVLGLLLPSCYVRHRQSVSTQFYGRWMLLEYCLRLCTLIFCKQVLCRQRKHLPILVLRICVMKLVPQMKSQTASKRPSRTGASSSSGLH